MSPDKNLQPVYEIEIPKLKDPSRTAAVRNRLRTYLQRTDIPKEHWGLELSAREGKIVILSYCNPLLPVKVLQQGLDGIEGARGYQIKQLPISNPDIIKQLEAARKESKGYQGTIEELKRNLADAKESEGVLQGRVERLIKEKDAVSEQLSSTREAYDARIGTLEANIRKTEQTIDELKTLTTREVMEEILFEPQKLIGLLMESGYQRLKSLEELFESFKAERQRGIFEMAAKEAEIEDLKPKQYEEILKEGKLSWEESTPYKNLKPRYDDALERTNYLNNLKGGRVGSDMPQGIKDELIKSLESGKKNFDDMIEAFREAERRHRRLSWFSETVDRLDSEEPIEKSITDMKIVYACYVNENGTTSLYVPLDNELSKTYLGSLLIRQLDDLGRRISDEMFMIGRFLTYDVRAEDIMDTCNRYSFSKLGVKLSVVKLMEPQIRVEELQKPSAEVLGERILENMRERGGTAHPRDLKVELDIKYWQLYKAINPLLENGQIERIGEKGSRNVVYRLKN